jgi:serine O-acetyltransferase
MFENFKADIRENVPSYQQWTPWRAFRYCLRSPSIRALALIRLQAWLFRIGLPTLPVTKLLEHFFAIDISKRADIGPGLHLPTPWGVVIAPHVCIGARCHLGADVQIVLGARYKQGPTLGDDVFIADNSKVIGRIALGDGAIIGMSSVVTRDIPPGAAAMGNPAEIVEGANQQISIAA